MQNATHLLNPQQNKTLRPILNLKKRYFHVRYKGDLIKHPLGNVEFNSFFRAFSDSKAKAAALKILLLKDFENGYCYLRPVIEEISEVTYRNAVTRFMTELENTVLLASLLLVVFGEEEIYDDDQIKRVIELFFDPQTDEYAYSEAMLLNYQTERFLSENEDVRQDLSQGQLTAFDVVASLHDAVQGVREDWKNGKFAEGDV